MKLKISEKWRWVAKDSNGHAFMYTHKPTLDGTAWVRTKGFSCNHFSALYCPNLGPYQDSLHEILPDGTLIKCVERPDLKVDDRVLVRDREEGDWLPRHFAGWEKDGRLRAFYGGQTSWTVDTGAGGVWKKWKLQEDNQ